MLEFLNKYFSELLAFVIAILTLKYNLTGDIKSVFLRKKQGFKEIYLN